jgi:cation transport regulator ChaC
MHERCAAAQFVVKALLIDYELQFTHTSNILKSGTADIIPAPGKSVWGVVYELTAEDRRQLDKKEGVSTKVYQPQDLTVQAEGDPQRSLKVYTYVICSKESPRPKPSTIYLKYLLDGAKKWQLPSSYVELLRATETLPSARCDI